ncbi:MAG: nuclear transport factor 2 family protein [Gemmatimonadetes bacterium]|nr:nuclear transport factor 2 family protein [Gemmatimonadota bacterium]
MELPPELERVLRDYEQAWSGGDAEGLARLFTEDGFVPRPHGWTRGRAAILDAYASTGGDLRLRAHAFATSGTVGWIAGSYGYAEEAATRDMGRFLLALRRDSADAPWRIAADLDHGNQGSP